MRVRVKLYLHFREILGESIELEMEEGSRVRDLINALKEKGLKAREYIVLRGGNAAGPEEPLEEGEYLVFPPVDGG